MYSKNEAYPVTRAKFPLQIIDGGGISYTNEHAFNNRENFGWTDVSDIPKYNRETHNISWKYNWGAQTFWEVTEKTDEEIQSIINQLLFESDWSQIINEATGDSIRWIGVIGNVIDESKRLEWEVYRQELRDIPNTQTLPYVTWPTRPI